MVFIFRGNENVERRIFGKMFIPFIPVELPIICVFADASRGAFGACAYIRNVDVSGLVAVRFVAAKSRVVPLKELSIPRLELQATRMQLKEIILFTDSTITLAWIRSK